MLASLVRTLVPALVGLLGPWAARWLGLTDAEVTGAVSTVVFAVYYVAVRLAERHLSPRFGWLLGLAQAPVYRQPSPLLVGRTDFDQLVRESRRDPGPRG